MYKIIKKEWLSKTIISMDILAPKLVRKAQPGQFLIVKLDEEGERIPLTICDYDREKGSVTIIFQVVGKSTQDMGEAEVGDFFSDVVGPLGKESELLHETEEELKKKKIIFIAGGVGTAPIFPQAKWLSERGIDFDLIMGARTKEALILEEKLREYATNLYICTDDGSYGKHGRVTDLLEELAEKGNKYDEAIAIGPMIMMKFTALLTKKLGIKTTVSLNPLMIDGTGMCGACRVKIGDEVKFACVDGPEFDGHLVNYDEAQNRLKMREEETLPEDEHSEACPVHQEENNDSKKRLHPKMLEPISRQKTFQEVNRGYSFEEAQQEASRCLECKNPRCVGGCPVGIDIPGFIGKLKEGKIEEASEILSKYTKLPSVCGRVCPQEKQCEGVCVVGIRGDAVAIGLLERFVGDWNLENKEVEEKEQQGKRIAVIGSGPAGLAAAGELTNFGYKVDVFESLHKLGGVLTYGIPEFRLPKAIVDGEIERIKKQGVRFYTNVVVGKTITVDELLEEEGYSAVFIGSGAGLPRFMGIPGENSRGVLSANEFLTRVNLMKGNIEKYHTPVTIGEKVAVIGAGNVSMDAARVAKRLGAESTIVYRRSKDEIPARAEEVEHAIEEDINFELLTNPVEILANDQGEVIGIKCVKMELGEPDESGRRRPKEIEGSEFVIDVDTVVMSIGTSSNDLVTGTTRELETTRWNTIKTIEGTETQTSREGIFAGGDIVTGAATVILAMGAGKQGAHEIHEYLKDKS